MLDRRARGRAVWLLVWIGVFLSVLSVARPASAYPWMIRHQYQGCVPCHADPSGAGLLTDYGRAMGENVLRTRYGSKAPDEMPVYARFAFGVQRWYGVVVGGVLSGVIGVGLYPLMGTRVWCRFFCPMAALLGLIQKLGRFRITVKKDMCISCGNCSTYCEMGIDVRAYAMANQDVRRAACVGCGMCAHVCPRGVLKLENRPARWKAGQPIRVYAVDL